MKKTILLLTIVFLCLYAFPVSAEGTAVSVGKTYELITPASAGYPDTSANKLTNGTFAAATTDTSDVVQSYYQSTEYVGFNQTAKDANENFVILLDLGAGATDLSSFEISYLNQTDIGIYSPESVTFSVSDVRNGSYTPVGTATITDSTADGVSEMKKATVTPSGVISGQYVKIEIKIKTNISDESGGTFNAGWVFVDEITVNGASAESVAESSTENSFPQTGDDTTILAFVLLSITTICLTVLVIRKRKSKEL